MIVNFQQEAAKRRDHSGRARATFTEHHAKTTRMPVRNLPVVDFGSGWYHSAAVKDAETIQSHRD